MAYCISLYQYIHNKIVRYKVIIIENGRYDTPYPTGNEYGQDGALFIKDLVSSNF